MRPSPAPGGYAPVAAAAQKRVRRIWAAACGPRGRLGPAAPHAFKAQLAHALLLAAAAQCQGSPSSQLGPTATTVLGRRFPTSSLSLSVPFHFSPFLLSGQVVVLTSRRQDRTAGVRLVCERCVLTDLVTAQVCTAHRGSGSVQGCKRTAAQKGGGQGTVGCSEVPV